MPNLIGLARSNYFAVRDEAAFRAFCERYGLEVLEDTLEGGERVFGFASEDGGVPTFYTERETGRTLDGNPLAELAAHLVPGDVAVVYEIANTGTAVLSGYSYAVNSEGATASVNLDDIYEAARRLGTREITPCRN